MSKHIPSFPPEFRTGTIRLAGTSGRPHAPITMTGETLRLWLKQADVDHGKRSYDLTHRRAGGGAASAPQEPNSARRARDPKQSAQRALMAADLFRARSFPCGKRVHRSRLWA